MQRQLLNRGMRALWQPAKRQLGVHSHRALIVSSNAGKSQLCGATPLRLSTEPAFSFLGSQRSFTTSPAKGDDGKVDNPGNVPDGDAKWAEEHQKKWSWVLNLMGYNSPKAVRARRAYWMFISSQTRGPIRAFYDNCGVPDTPAGKVAIIQLHLWLMKRKVYSELKGTEEEGEEKELLSAILDQFLMFTQKLLRDHETHVMLLTKYTQDVQKRTFGTMIAYDIGIEAYEKGDGPEALAGALWRNLYGHDEELDTRNLTLMVDYVLQELDMLDELDSKSFFQGRIPWGEPPESPPDDDTPFCDVSLHKAPTVSNETIKWK